MCPLIIRSTLCNTCKAFLADMLLCENSTSEKSVTKERNRQIPRFISAITLVCVYVCSVMFFSRETATHSSVFAWKIQWTEQPGRLQYRASQESLNWYLNVITKVPCNKRGGNRKDAYERLASNTWIEIHQQLHYFFSL